MNEQDLDLSPENIKRMQDERDRLLGICFNCEPARRPETEDAIGKLYGFLGQKAPPAIWVDGPVHGARVAAVLCASDEDIVTAIAEVAANNAVAAGLDIGITESAFKAMAPVFIDDVSSRRLPVCGDWSLAMAHAILPRVARIMLSRVTRDQIASIAQSYSFGGALGYWPTYYTVAKMAGQWYTTEENERLEVWMQLVLSAGWWMPLTGAVICCERNEWMTTAEGQLHNKTKAAMRWPDGFEVYAWHGNVIPAEWITDIASVPPETALKWPNIEQRRCLQEIMGWDKVLAQLPNRVIHADRDPQVGELIEVDLPDAGAARFLRVVCHTGRTFALSVPMEMETAAQANAWTYGIDEKDITNRAFRR